MTASKSELTKVLRIRVSEDYFNRLKETKRTTNCGSISELARAILYKEKIRFYYTDASLKVVGEELAGIRQELKAIGRNINQITKSFHEGSPEQRVFHALRARDEYKHIEDKVDKLLIMVSEISKKWLQGSGRENI